jgi:flagellar motor switch protein FliM
MTTADLIRRKSAAHRAPVGVATQGADRAFRVSWGRAVLDCFKIQLEVEKISVDLRSVAELVEIVPDFALISILDGPAQGAGALVISQSIVAGFIEAQTVGRVRGQDLSARRPTRTDGAMVMGVIDKALSILEKSLGGDADIGWAGGFRFARFLDDPRPLHIALDDIPLRILTAEVSLAGGMRTGKILFAVPQEGRFPMSFAQSDEMGDATGAAFQAEMQDRVEGARVQLDAVLVRLSLPMADILTMAAGMILPLQDAGLDGLSLEGLGGRCVALAKLGQNRGMRALRLSDCVQAPSHKIVRASRVLAAPNHTNLAADAMDFSRRSPAGATILDAPAGLSAARLRDDAARWSSAPTAQSQHPGAHPTSEIFELRSTGTD